MDTQKMGKFLAELRKEKGVTQAEVAFELMTGRENISKWERGVNTPTAESLILLSKYYDVSVNEILIGERKNEENKEQLENMSVEVMKVGEKKLKVVIKNFVSVIVIMVGLFLVYYFVNTYNTIRVYKIDGASDNFFVREGLAIFSKGKSYLRIGTIEPKKENNYDSYEVFFKDGDKEEKLFVSDDTNYTLLTSYEYEDSFSYSNLNEIEKSTYIKIKYGDEEDIIKLNFERDMVNNFLVTTKEKDKSANNKIEDDVNVNIQKLEAYVKKNWKYNKAKDIYEYSETKDNIKYQISYNTNSFLLSIIEEKNNISNKVEINFNFKYLFFSTLDDNNDFDEKYTYNINEKKCLSGECNQEQIDYYLDNYYYKFIE